MTALWRRSEYRSQVLLMLGAFLAFALHATGLLGFGGTTAPAFELHAGLRDDLLAGRVPDALLGVDSAVFAAVGLGLAVVLPALRPIAASLVTFLAMLPPFAVAWFRPTPPPFVPLEFMLLTVLVLFSLKVLLGYFHETRARQTITAAFGQYVPPALVERIAREPDAFSMEGESRELSVLFCDIVAFSRLSEQLEPRELARLLNIYLTMMTDVLHGHDATIDKYIGDAIMAFWGAPVPQPDHATRALAAALDMQAATEPLALRFDAAGWPAIDIRIGINTGTVSVGNMGSRYRIAYTAVGDAVNLAARLEALTRVYGVDVLVSEATRGASGAPCREIDHVRVKGRDQPTRIFQPLREAPAGGALAAHDAALDAYYAGDWERARARFAELAAAHPADRYYSTMLARVGVGSPPPDWHGVVTFGGEISV